MKYPLLFLACILFTFNLFSQSNEILQLLPEGTTLHNDIQYNANSHHKQKLDLYMPPNADGEVPLVVLMPGGAWLYNDKYNDIKTMHKTMSEILNSGYALAAVDYRFSTEEIFPAQIQDCNKAISYLYDNSKKLGLNRDKFALMGFSAGGHLASLAGLSKNNNIDEFFVPESTKDFKIRGVIDFYGPTDLILFPNNSDPRIPESILIGDALLSRPDLAKWASPTTYVDENDPPFLIIHGEKDETVLLNQSQLLRSWLTIYGVTNELFVLKDAPHSGNMFDVEEVTVKVVDFLKTVLK